MSRPKSYIINDNRPVRIFESSADFYPRASSIRKLIIAVAFNSFNGVLSVDYTRLFSENHDSYSLHLLAVTDQVEAISATAELVREHFKLHKEEMESWVDD